MPHPHPLPTDLIDRPFSTREARDRGIPPQRLRADDLFVPFSGVRSSARPVAIEELARAYAVRLRPAQYFSHTSAAALYALPLPSRFERQGFVEVTTPGRDKSVHALGVLGHRSTRAVRLRQIAGVPVSCPAETWLALAGLLTVDELVVIGDALVCPVYRIDGTSGDSLATLDELGSAVAATTGLRGLTVARRALPQVRVGAQSPRETRLRLQLVRHGLPEPELNQIISSTGGGFLGRVDLLFRSAGLILEYEGDHHRVDPRTWRNDIRRVERLTDAGWRVVRVTVEDMDDHQAELVGRVRRLLGSRGRR